MSIFKTLQTRQNQKKANDFIKSLSRKTDKQIEQAFLDNKEFQNNEIVLSYLFFNHPRLIRILPLKFQIERINSNLTMFRYGTAEARKQLISSWLKDNKYFMNANVVQFTEEEEYNYLKLYFKQPTDVAKLYMDDLRRVIKILADIDIKATEKVINIIKDDLTERQWIFVIDACPSLIRLASQSIQNQFAEDEKYSKYLNNEAREKFINKQLDKVKGNISLLSSMPIDVKTEYINRYPYMLNSVDIDTLIELLKYDINLIKYLNIPRIRSNSDMINKLMLGLLDNIETKPIKEIINIFINKGLLNARGKLYRYDKKSNDNSYQYTITTLSIIQNLDIEQIIALIKVDVNYSMAYLLPLYNEKDSREIKEKAIIDSNSRCLELFKAYYGEGLYSNYYKVINKIYNEYLNNIEKYNYEKDYSCVFELFKILFNKDIMYKNPMEKITVFIGLSLLYKTKISDNSKNPTIDLLSELLTNAYERKVIVSNELYYYNSLEMFDSRLSFISKELLEDFFRYNFVNISSLLFIIKGKKTIEYFKKYYEIIVDIYGESKETLFRAIENFHYYIDILKNIEDKELNDKELDNLVELLASFGNIYNITKKDQLEKLDLTILKKLISELSNVKDEDVYRNLLCNYLFNKGYNENGTYGLLETDTIEALCDSYTSEELEEFRIGDKNIFTKDEVLLYTLIELLFSNKSNDILLSYVNDFVSKKINRNIINITELFNKLKKYRLEIINSKIVRVDEIEILYQQKPELVDKSTRDGVNIYVVKNQDFKVLVSSNDDGIYYRYTDISKIKNSCYGYENLTKMGSIRFTTKDKLTYLMINKDNLNRKYMKAKYIVVVGPISDGIVKIAKNNNLSIVKVEVI